MHVYYSSTESRKFSRVSPKYRNQKNLKSTSMKGYLCSASYLLLLSTLLAFGTGADKLQPGESLNVTQKITSSGDTFALGFFSSGNSTNRYVGIWYNKMKERTVIWVANIENPLTNSAGFLILSEDGNIRLFDGKKSVIWTSNVSVIGRNSTTAVLSDSGNFVLRRTTDHAVVWQSFDNPIGSFLPGMKLTLNIKTRQSIRIFSWKDVDDPTPGIFYAGIDPQTPRQMMVWRGSEPYWRDGVWETVVSAQVLQMQRNHVGYITTIANDEEISFLFTSSENSNIARYVLTPTGAIELESWDDSSEKWELLSSTKNNNCSVYGWCGPFGSCDNISLPTVCNCLKGFRPKYQQEWETGNWSGGCVREMNLDCGTKDEFRMLKRTKLPDISISLGTISAEACASECLSNCSCTAYSYTNVSGWGTWNCLIWVGDLIDLVENFNTEFNLNIRVAGPQLGMFNLAFSLIDSHCY